MFLPINDTTCIHLNHIVVAYKSTATEQIKSNKWLHRSLLSNVQITSDSQTVLYFRMQDSDLYAVPSDSSFYQSTLDTINRTTFLHAEDIYINLDYINTIHLSSAVEKNKYDRWKHELPTGAQMYEECQTILYYKVKGMYWQGIPCDSPFYSSALSAIRSRVLNNRLN